MSTELSTALMVTYYVVAIGLILLVIGAMKFLGQPRFRDENGDITTEVGFEEDSIGKVRKGYRYPTQDEIDDPHVVQEKFMQ